MAYFFVTSDSSGQLSTTTMETVLAEIMKGAGGNIESLAAYTKSNTYSATTGKAGFMSNGNGKFDAGTTVSGFLIILDSDKLATAKNYMLAKTSKNESELSKTAGASGAMTFGWGSQANNTWQAVPEPTSAMLIVLGVAALALRRKRA